MPDKVDVFGDVGREVVSLMTAYALAVVAPEIDIVLRSKDPFRLRDADVQTQNFILLNDAAGLDGEVANKPGAHGVNRFL